MGGARAADAPRSRAMVRITRDSGGIVVLQNGAALLWGDRRIQVTRSEGTLTPPIDLPCQWLHVAIGDPVGALLAGRTVDEASRIEDSQVFAVDFDGRLLTAWTFRRDALLSLAPIHGHRWASFSLRVDELRADGTSKTVLPSEYGQILATSEGAPIFCAPTNFTKERNHAPYCQALEGAKWKAQGAWRRTPFVCGGYLVEPGFQPEVVIRRVSDGVEVGRGPRPREAALACGRGDQLLIGTTTIEARHLPGLAVDWRRSVEGGPIAALAAAGEDVVTVSLRGAVTWARPPATPRRPDAAPTIEGR
jgi:hypothetical protein